MTFSISTVNVGTSDKIARIGCAISGADKPGGGDLVKQRLKQVMIRAVNQRDARRGMEILAKC